MATHYKGDHEEILALNAFIKLVRSTNTVNAQLQPLFAANKLTESQFGVLEALYHLGPIYQSEIGKKIMKTGGNITMVIDNLEKQQLVQRNRDAKDRRFIKVHLTEKGTRLIESIFPEHVARITKLFEVLSQEEQTELARLCKKLGTSE